MVKIKVTNIKSKIIGLDSSALNLLSTHLSVKVPNYYFSNAFKNHTWDGTQRFLTRPANTFPTGLLPKVVEFIQDLDNYEIEIENQCMGCNYKVLPVVDEESTVISEDKTLRDYQVDTINAVASNKVLDMPFYRGVINIATNGGKTVIAEGILKGLYPQLKKNGGVFLFLTHSKEIARQAQRSIENDLQIDTGFIGDGAWGVKTVTIALISTLYSRLKKQKVEFLELKDKVAAVILDEMHHSSSTSWQEVLNSFENCSIRLGLTGTVDKSNPVNEMKLYACTGSIIKKISNDFLIKSGVSAKPVCLMFQVSQPDVDDLEYADAYNLGIVENQFRHEIIYNIVKKEVDSNNHVLILVERLEHGQQLEETLKWLGKEVYFTNGQISTAERELYLNKLKSGELDVLIASNILDEGVDVSGINAVIYARGMKSMRKLLQGIGRGLRLKDDQSGLRFYDFIDDTNRKLLLHSKERYETLSKEKFQIKLMNTEDFNKMSWDEVMG